MDILDIGDKTYECVILLVMGTECCLLPNESVVTIVAQFCVTSCVSFVDTICWYVDGQLVGTTCTVFMPEIFDSTGYFNKHYIVAPLKVVYFETNI